MTAPAFGGLETLLRARLPLLEEAPLDLDTDLPSFGLDSMGAVQLLFEVEAAFDVVFPDDAIKPATFLTPRALLAAMAAAGVDVAEITS